MSLRRGSYQSFNAAARLLLWLAELFTPVAWPYVLAPPNTCNDANCSRASPPILGVVSAAGDHAADWPPGQGEMGLKGHVRQPGQLPLHSNFRTPWMVLPRFWDKTHG